VNSVSKTAYGFAVGGFIPIIPGRADKRGNSLSVTGEYAWSLGVADEYVGLNPGIANPALPKPTDTYTPNIDPGLVAYSADGALHLIQWQTYMVGLQYTIPGLDGRLWISGNYSHTDSNNTKFHGAAAKLRDSEDFVDASVFGDLTPAVRLGAEYAYFADHYVDGKDATNSRFQFSAFYIF
jgi:hypothetical protein